VTDKACRIYGVIPCSCGSTINESWEFNGSTIQSAPMWPCAGEPGKYVVYRCYSCGKEIKKDISELRCDSDITIGMLTYVCDSNGNFSWKCPVHGIYMTSVDSLGSDEKIYHAVEESGIGICCAQEKRIQESRMESAMKYGTSKCICCNRVCPNDEVAKLPYKGNDATLPAELAICEQCFETEDALMELEDKCMECEKCSYSDQFSMSEFYSENAIAGKCFYIQNVNIDDEGNYSGFELVCHKTNQTVAEVESNVVIEEDEYDLSYFAEEDYEEDDSYEGEDFE